MPGLLPQLLLALAVTVPAPVVQFTSILVLPCPAVIVPFEVVQVLAGCGETVATLKFTDALGHHVVGVAVIMLGIEGAPLIVTVLAWLTPGVHNDVLAVTLNGPLVNVGDTFNRMVGLP